MIYKYVLLSALMLVGCGQSQEEEFRAALPTRTMLEVSVPAPGSQGLAGQGQTSGLLERTRESLLKMNRATQELVELMDAVSAQPPTTVTSNTVVWGPYTDASSDSDWLLRVTKRAQGSVYEYELESRLRNASGWSLPWVVRGYQSAGIEDGRVIRGLGTGGLSFHWLAELALPEQKEGMRSLSSVQYGHSGNPGSMEVAVNLKGTNEHYHYFFTPDLGHELNFVLLSDMYESGDGHTPELLSIKSRWRPDGAGRADVRLSGGDLPDRALYSECWDAGFTSRYVHASYDPGLGYGTEATDCAFTTARHPQE